MSDQPTAYHGTGTSNSAPTVDVHGLAVTHGEVDSIEDPGHLLRIARYALVNDRIPLIPNDPPELPGFHLGYLGIRYQFPRFCKVDEMTDSRL